MLARLNTAMVDHGLTKLKKRVLINRRIISGTVAQLIGLSLQLTIKTKMTNLSLAVRL